MMIYPSAFKLQGFIPNGALILEISSDGKVNLNHNLKATVGIHHFYAKSKLSGIKRKQLKKINRVLTSVIFFELLIIAFFFLKNYSNKINLKDNPESDNVSCLQEGKRYTVGEATANSRICEIEIRTDEDLALLAKESKNLTNVKSVYFRKTPNSKIPSEIANLKNLTVLNFHHTFNTVLPPEIGTLKKLEVLKMDQADIEVIPAEIGELDNLTSLILITNARKITLPAEIGRLKNLKELILSDNPAVELPASLAEIRTLEEIDLTGSNLQSVNPSIYKLVKLKLLNLSNNQIREISSEISNLTSLKHLVLRGNKLNADDIEQLKKLLPETKINY